MATDLIRDVLDTRCSYEPVPTQGADADDDPFGAHTRAQPDTGSAGVRVPIDVAGRTVGHLCADVHASATEDEAFVKAVGSILSASLSRTRAESVLLAKSFRDPLTDLPSWGIFHDRLACSLDRSGDLPVAVLCCDITGLKDINDEYGHTVGDMVVREVANRLRRFASTHGTVTRFGGDVFVLLEPTMGGAAAGVTAQRIVNAAREPIGYGAVAISAPLRVGYAVADDRGEEPEQVVKNAQMALMMAKREGLSMAAFTDRVRTQLVDRRRLIRNLRAAIEGRQFYLEYQPIVRLPNRDIVGVEALARWRDPNGVQVRPDIFIALAEETGMIGELGRLIFEQAIGQLAYWTEQVPDLANLRMALNLSPGQLSDPGAVEHLTQLLARLRIDPQRITLEVTESGLEEATDEIATSLSRFRELGMELSLDDFGTGHSTLVRLMKFPVTGLKIDRQFVAQKNPAARAIVPAVIGLAHAAGLTVVAEGIETGDQLALVECDGCDFGQGYLFARPLSAEAIPGCVLASRVGATLSG